jgi:hypothetical protein
MNRRIARSIAALGALSMSIAGSLSMAQIQPANARPAPRPELNNQLIRDPRTGGIFWVEQGLARHVPNMTVFSRVFLSQFNSVNSDTIQFGNPLPDYAILAKCNQGNHPLNNAIFLIDRESFTQSELSQGTKRHITSPTAFNHNKFNPNSVKPMSCAFLNQMKTGAPIN